MKIKLYTLVFLWAICSVYNAQAQTKRTVSGTIKSASTGETLIGATVVCLDETYGAITNEYGHYSLTIPPGKYRLFYSLLGYVGDTMEVNLTANRVINVELNETSYGVEEVVVTADFDANRISRARVGVEHMSSREIEKIPIIFGEKDILKTIQLLPGIKSAGEGSSGFTVRGGALDQNLILLDEAPVYNASHLMGFFSTFNAAAIKDVAVYKGNYPANYGGRVASVVDITMNNGSTKQYRVSGGIGIISSNVGVEGPIQKGRSSFLVTARRTYADAFLTFVPEFKGNKLYFYDINAKANVEINSKNRIYFSGYFGRDKLALRDIMGIDWGNKTATLRWNSIVGPRVFSNTTILYSDYNYKIGGQFERSDISINSRIEDWNLKQDFRFSFAGQNNLRVGFNSIYHTITPTRFKVGTMQSLPGQESRSMWENAAYASFDAKPARWFAFEVGLRATSNTLVGEAIYNDYDQGVLQRTITIPQGKMGKTFFNLEPRVTASFTLNNSTSIKAAYGRNIQHLHMLSNSIASSPTDQWVGSSYTVEPTICDQYSLGFFKNFADNRFEVTVEAYYKNMLNEVDFKTGADIFTAIDLESQLLTGKGRAYGIEFLIKKKVGDFTGWIGYTLSRSERKIDQISNNNWYPTRQDRTHDVSVVLMYQISPKWEVSAAWCYNTGNAITMPSGKYVVDGNLVFQYQERNGYRMPDYHRLDIGATYTPVKRKRFESSLTFSLYNAYGRRNAYMIYFEEDPYNVEGVHAIELSLFRWVPSITYNFKF